MRKKMGDMMMGYY